jgi:putative hydrolase of the HAD superfamily
VDEKALGRRLQLARKRAGLTQQELCQKAGLSYSTLAKIERGAIRSPSVFTVAAIAHATNTPLENLLDVPQAPAGRGQNSKKRSKSGITFVYFDVNGTLVRFFHKAFTQIAEVSGQPTDIIETLFWRYHDALAAGRTSMEEFNRQMAQELGMDTLDWRKYYMDNVEGMPDIKGLIDWVAENYEVGILSNNLPGFIDEMRQNKVIPDVDYKAIVDSSKVGLLKPDPKIYETAQQLAGVEPSQILLVDDNRPNLIAADHAGWHGIWFDEIQPTESIERVKKALEF